MRFAIRFFAAVVVAFNLNPAAQDSAFGADKSHPNVVFILVDDMGLHDLGVEGSTYYETPNIDALARSGIRFTQGYANCRVCSPSRASIHLGKFPARHGITQYIGAKSGMAYNRDDRLIPSEYGRHLPFQDITIAEAMKEGGYETFFAGKWHLGGEDSWPDKHGYDHNFGGHHAGTPPGGFFAPFKNPTLENHEDGENLTLRLAEETAKFIKDDREKPFFAMLCFYAVHAPVQTTESLWKKYQAKGTPIEPGGERFKVDRTLPVRQVQDHPVYAGLVETTDTAVGRVMQALEDSGQADNTIVVFTSDNGGVSSGDHYATSNLPLRGGKGRGWEGGIREPLYIRYPKSIQPGSTNATPVTGADLYPTLLQLCGLPLRPEQHVDATSLVPLLNGDSIPPRPLYWHYPHYDNQGGEPSSLFRDGDWKLIHYYEDGRNELYHLPTDVGETSDLSRTHPVRTETMAKQLKSWLESVDAKIPQPDPRYDPARTQAKFEARQTTFKQKLEKQHAQMHQPDWKPNRTWWGSQPVTRD